jgi:branched-chain amino acid transport system substrate-binding protein
MHRRALLAALLTSALIASACGGRFNAEQRRTLAAGRSRVIRAGAPSASTETTAPAAGGAGAATGGPGDATAGVGAATDATPGGGGASGTGTGTAGFSGDNGGATDVGVTANSLSIGNVSIMSGPIPGFGETSQRAVQAYVNYANSQGGVFGRQLRLLTADDRLDSGGNRSETENLKPKVFAFVGGLSVVDDGGATVLQGTNIPDVGIALSDGRVKLANNFSTAPIDPTDGGNGFVPPLTYYKNAYGVKNGAVIWPGQAIARERAQGYIKDMQRAGINVVYSAEASVTETNYAGFATQIQQKKVDVLVTALEVNGMASLAKALKQQGYQPKISAYGPQAYGHAFIKLAGDAAEGVTLNVANEIFEDTGAPAVKTFNDWFSRTNPGLTPDYFAIIAWSAAELFVTALRAAGPRPTRAGVLAQLGKITSFDAGGLLAPINPAKKKWASCFMIIRVEHGTWKRVEPAAGYHC